MVGVTGLRDEDDSRICGEDFLYPADGDWDNMWKTYCDRPPHGSEVPHRNEQAPDMVEDPAATEAYIRGAGRA